MGPPPLPTIKIFVEPAGRHWAGGDPPLSMVNSIAAQPRGALSGASVARLLSVQGHLAKATEVLPS